MHNSLPPIHLVLLIALLVWSVAGIAWLLPMKWRLLKRVGFDKSNGFLLELAFKGDHDAQKLHRCTRAYLAVGILCALGLALIRGSAAG
ncbi:hypothetical protein [Hydrogenophaga sp.]|uniref:hypothetical protein n=1 Tax=Hydrogenophaga sp. TaxID=1904254 RepID=UPI002623EAAE|nr:hypothetical protein [Hydrogenophaga sp.]MCW5654042.1 hypothetical protein [Hydrogenophaga sp.]